MTSTQGRDIAIVTGDPSNNQMGRTESVARVCTAAGFHTTIYTTNATSPIWRPLIGSALASTMQRVSTAELAHRVRDAHAIVAIKPRLDSLGEAWTATRGGKSLIVDIDDPDLEVMRAAVLSKAALRHPARASGTARDYLTLRRMLRHLPRLTSNPTLQARYGGYVLPHGRPDFGPGSPHTSNQPVVAFIGTPRPHKGIQHLRQAVADLQDHGFVLKITAPRPADAAKRPWEYWLGELNEAQSMALLKESDIVALPSLPVGWGRAQLPMKLVDGMLAGRAMIVSRLAPLEWALGETGLMVRPACLEDLREALQHFADPTVRASYGEAARRRAIASFTPEALAAGFRSFVTENAMSALTRRGTA